LYYPFSRNKVTSLCFLISRKDPIIFFVITRSVLCQPLWAVFEVIFCLLSTLVTPSFLSVRSGLFHSSLTSPFSSCQLRQGHHSFFLEDIFSDATVIFQVTIFRLFFYQGKTSPSCRSRSHPVLFTVPPKGRSVFIRPPPSPPSLSVRQVVPHRQIFSPLPFLTPLLSYKVSFLQFPFQEVSLLIIKVQAFCVHANFFSHCHDRRKSTTSSLQFERSFLLSIDQTLRTSFLEFGAHAY